MNGCKINGGVNSRRHGIRIIRIRVLLYGFSVPLTYCIQIEFFYNATFYTLEDGVLKEIECIFYEIEGIFDGFGQPGR